MLGLSGKQAAGVALISLAIGLVVLPMIQARKVAA